MALIGVIARVHLVAGENRAAIEEMETLALTRSASLAICALYRGLHHLRAVIHAGSNRASGVVVISQAAQMVRNVRYQVRVANQPNICVPRCRAINIRQQAVEALPDFGELFISTFNARLAQPALIQNQAGGDDLGKSGVVTADCCKHQVGCGGDGRNLRPGNERAVHLGAHKPGISGNLAAGGVFHTASGGNFSAYLRQISPGLPARELLPIHQFRHPEGRLG